MGKRLRNLTLETRTLRIVRPNQTVVKTVDGLQFVSLTDDEYNLYLDPPPPLNPAVWSVQDTGTEPPPPIPPTPGGATTTDALPEGLINKYFLDGRARTAAVDNAIVSGITDKAPSQAAVFTALSGKPNTGANVGTGAGNVFKQLNAGNLEFRKIAAGTGVTVTQAGDNIEIAATGASGEANTASNRGTSGAGKAEVFAQKTGVDLEFKRIAQGEEISVTQNADTITIASATQIAEVTLSPSQVTNLDVTPINLVAAPGSGFSIIVESVELFLNFNSTAYSGSGDLVVEYSLSAPIIQFATTGFLTAGSTQRRFKIGHSEFDMLLENNLVRITSTAPVTGGDSALKAKVRYKTIQVTS